MEFQVRKATKNDMPSVLKLINELAVYEREPDAVEVTVVAAGFGQRPNRRVSSEFDENGGENLPDFIRG